MPPCCAICVEPMPLGGVEWVDEGKTFTICRACAFDMAREGHGVERSYEGGGPSITTAEMSAGARRVMGDLYDKENRDLQQPFVMPAISDDEAIIRDFKYDSKRRQRTGSVRYKTRTREKIGRIK